MKMNQWVDFDTGDEAQSENVFPIWERHIA